MKQGDDQREKSLEKILTTAISKSYEDCPPPPDGEKAWERMRERLSQDYRKQKRQLFPRKWTAVAALIIGFTFVAALMPGQLYALTHVRVIVQKLQDSIVVFTGSYMNSTANKEVEVQVETSAPQYDASSSDKHSAPAELNQSGTLDVAEPSIPMTLTPIGQVSWDEVVRQYPKIAQPAYLPEGYLYDQVMALPGHDGSLSMVVMEYRNVDTNHVIRITYEPVPESGVKKAKQMNTEHAMLKELTIHSNKAIMIYVPDTYVNLMWYTESAEWLINGFVSEDEAVRIAESLPVD